MSRRIIKNVCNYFKNPLVEGKYPVIPPREIPPHIIKPPYVGHPNPQFGEYEGRPVPHTPDAVSSTIFLKKS